jgi:hypothetical protein
MESLSSVEGVNFPDFNHFEANRVRDSVNFGKIDRLLELRTNVWPDIS